LNFLTDRDSATTTEISKELKLPISYVQYNIEQSQKAGLIEWENYHYLEKGKEVKDYTLSNKYAQKYH